MKKTFDSRDLAALHTMIADSKRKCLNGPGVLDREMLERAETVLTLFVAGQIEEKPSAPVRKPGPLTVRDKIKLGHYDSSLPNNSSRENKAWREDRKRLSELFKQDALKEVGLDKHPKGDAAYSKAWDDAHSYGYEEVMTALEELALLLK